jgi:hypothetical protein
MKESYEKLKQSLSTKKRKTTFAGFITKLKKNFNALLAALKQSWQSFLKLLAKYGLVALVCVVTVAILLLLIYPALSAVIKRRLAHYACEKLMKRASKLITSNPSLCVKICYLVIRDSLNAAGYPRERNMELFHYGNSLENLDVNTPKDILVIFLLFTQRAYSKELITPRDSMEAWQRLSKVRKLLLKTS